MGRDPVLDELLAEQLLRGRTELPTADDQLLADALHELRRTVTGPVPVPSHDLQRIFAQGVAGDAPTAGVPVALSRKRVGTARGWIPARLPVKAAGLGLMIKLALGAAAAAAAVSGVGMSTGSVEPGERITPVPQSGDDQQVLEDLPPGGFGPQSSDPDPWRPADANDSGVPGFEAWAPGRPTELDVPVVPAEPPGLDVADEAPVGAGRDRALVDVDPPAERVGPPADAPAGGSDRASDPPPATPAPPIDPAGAPSGPGSGVEGQPAPATDVAPPAADASAVPTGAGTDQHAVPAVLSSLR